MNFAGDPRSWCASLTLSAGEFGGFHELFSPLNLFIRYQDCLASRLFARDVIFSTTDLRLWQAV